MSDFVLDMEKYHALLRTAAAEGCVLLKNDRDALPLRSGDRVSVFGRIAWNYYKSGTGSGGLVNTQYVTGILDALRERSSLSLYQPVLDEYSAWLKSHPFEYGHGWGEEPWSQEEMPLSDTLVAEASANSDCALIVLGRTAGEDKDASNSPGSYLLTDVEKDMICKVCSHFTRSIVLLNVGSIIDMSWVAKYNPAAVMYIWQGGQEGGNGVADILTGAVSPCGKLTDTVGVSIDSYSSTKNFGDPKQNIYCEDIYIGYRYFETFHPESVVYPFGFGLSYTHFSVDVTNAAFHETSVTLSILIRNIGNFSGKEVVQVYAQKPQGKLGKPVKELVAYQKTPFLLPGDEIELHFEIPIEALASYDDSGLTGYKSCWVLEAGTYVISVGTDVRNCTGCLHFSLPKTQATEQLLSACAPTVSFNRIKPVFSGGKHIASQELVPTRDYDLSARIAGRCLPSGAFTGDKGLTVEDIWAGRCSISDFLSQLTDEQLCCFVRGEGMSSPKATPGTAAAIGGVTPWAIHYGIPVGCFSDGPSGIRMDCGTKATSLPSGTLLGCTWNDKLIEELFTYVGFELRKFHIDSLLGPGINIHRNPLCGRNFEYISEDPHLTGCIASAQLRGMARAGVTGTIKHMAANSQEYLRKENDSVLSERALREIYLRAFEICVKQGDAYSIMTSYNAINGVWAAGNYDLVAIILRQQMGYRGLVITDWWASMNELEDAPSVKNTHIMVRSQNDIYMVTEDSEKNTSGDYSVQSLHAGLIKRGDYLLAAEHILQFLMRSPTMWRKMHLSHPASFTILPDPLHSTASPNCDILSVNSSAASFCTTSGMTKQFRLQGAGAYELAIYLESNSSNALAQYSVSAFYQDALVETFAWHEKCSQMCILGLSLSADDENILRLYFPVGGITVSNIELRKKIVHE